MEHGLLMLEGGGIYRLGENWVSGHRRRFHLDGAVLPAVVRRSGKSTREISHLQRLEPAPAAIEMNRIDQELETLAAFQTRLRPPSRALFFRAGS